MTNAYKWLCAVASAVAVVAGSAWGAAQYINNEHAKLATRDSIEVASAQLDFLYDKQIESLVAQITRLNLKRNKSTEELRHLDYLRQELDRLKQMRAAKRK